jgi:hypothetical protein
VKRQRLWEELPHNYLVCLRPCVQLSCEDSGGRGAASIEEEGVWR